MLKRFSFVMMLFTLVFFGAGCVSSEQVGRNAVKSSGTNSSKVNDCCDLLGHCAQRQADGTCGIILD